MSKHQAAKQREAKERGDIARFRASLYAGFSLADIAAMSPEAWRQVQAWADFHPSLMQEARQQRQAKLQAAANTVSAGKGANRD